MTNQKLKGKAKETAATVKEKAGRATGNRQMEAQAKNQKTEAKVEKTVGKAREKIKKAI